MIVRYIIGSEAECGSEGIRSILNIGQAFFYIDAPARISLRALYTADATPPSNNTLQTYLKNHLPVDLGATQTVLLTSREISGPQSLRSRDGFTLTVAPSLITISNYHTLLTGRANDLAFVRRILHALMRGLVRPSINDTSCVCGPGAHFSYLSQPAELALAREGYRDGIQALLRFINWLKQSETNPHQPRMREPPASGLPLVQRYADHIVTTEGYVFRGKIVLMVLHFLSDLIPFVENVLRLGARPEDVYLVAKPYPYPRRDAISHSLEAMRIQFRRATEAESVATKAEEILNLLHQRNDLSRKRLLVIEDGGYFAPLLHRTKHRRLVKRCIGVVEQTTKGIRNSEREIAKGQPRIPILSVAKSSFKERYESPEIGRATVQNISRFVPNIKLSGRRAVVFGFGSIGMYVAESLNRAFNMGVSVVDNDPQKLVLANHRKDIVTEAARSYSKLTQKAETILVVGTTGGGASGRPSVSARLMAQFPDKTILVSTSSDRTEFDVEGLKRMAGNAGERIEEGNTLYRFTSDGTRKSLFLLAEGYPINFYGSDSVPNETIDPIMAMLMLCGVAICQDPQRFGRRIDAEAVDKICGPQERNIAAEYAKISRR